MSFAKNVHRYQKYVLGGIVGIMALTLVLSGQFGSAAPGESDKPFATFTSMQVGKGTVTEREWYRALRKARAWVRLEMVREIDAGEGYNAREMRPLLFRFREGPGLLAIHPNFEVKEEKVAAAARELLILGDDAAAKQIRATDDEVDDIILGFLARAGVPQDDVEHQQDFSLRYFLSDPETLREAVRDSILIEKALSMDVGGSNARYEDLFTEKLASAKSVRALVAGIDGHLVPADLVPVTDEEIRAEFEAKRATFKMPARVQIEYLMFAFDDIKTKLKAPTPEEIQKYYDDHKREFLKPQKRDDDHPDGDGHDHAPPPEEFKTLDEVREEIIKKINDAKAAKEAYETIKRISSKDFAQRWYQFLNEEEAKEPKDPKSVKERARKRTPGVFAEIQAQFKGQGIDLRNAITLPFEKNAREPFEKELGKSMKSDPFEWAFGNPVGEVALQLYQSDKGIALLRIANKTEEYDADLTGPVREKIRQDLVKDRAGQRAQRMADELVKRIREKGAPELEKLKARRDVEIQRSGHFSMTSQDSELAIKPPSLAQHVKRKLLLAPPEPAGTAPAVMEAQVVTGDMVGGDRRDWSFVVVVEDSVQVAPDVKDEDFLREARRQEMDELPKARQAHADGLVSAAGWKEVGTRPAPK